MTGKERAPSRVRKSVFGRLMTSSAHRFSFPTFYFLLYTFFSSSCSSPTPPTPPPPPGADTTSHDFIWDIDTLGDGNSSVLYDVAIINDTTIWAVGEIYLKDSTGQIDPTSYGLTKWNGRTWKHERISATAPQGYITDLVPRGIFAISANEVWFAAGGVHRLKGGVLTSYWINPFPGNPGPIWSEGQYAQRLWASSPSNVYAVGTQGAIARFEGTSWQKIESGTSLDLYDIWGSGTSNGTLEVLAVGGRLFHGLDRVILHVVGINATMLCDSAIPYGLHALWFKPDQSYLLVGDGIYRKASIQETTWKKYSPPLTSSYSFAVRASGTNNVFVVGAFGDVLHFNGSTWSSYRELSIPNDSYYAVAVTERLVVAVGGGGLVAIGRPVGQ